MNKKDFKILVVDDDEISRDVISALLSREGYIISTAIDGLDAIQVLRIEDVSLVITDLRMPGADGIEVLRYAVMDNPDVSVVILTAYGTLDTALEALKEGAYDYLTKPFRSEEIIYVVERVYKRALLINRNKELTKLLKDTYRDMEVVRTVADNCNPDITANWLERMERLKAINVLTPQDVDILKDRMIKGYEKRESINS